MMRVRLCARYCGTARGVAMPWRSRIGFSNLKYLRDLPILSAKIFSIPQSRGVCGQEATVRGIVVLGVVLVVLLSGERLWGDPPKLTGTRKSHSLLAPGQPAPDFVAYD